MINYHYDSVNPKYAEQPETWQFCEGEKLHYRVFRKSGELTKWVYRNSSTGCFHAARPGAPEIDTDDYDIHIVECRDCAPCQLCKKRFNWKNNLLTTLFSFLIWCFFGQFAFMLPFKALTSSDLINPVWAWITMIGLVLITMRLIKYIGISMVPNQKGLEGRLRCTVALFLAGFFYTLCVLGPIYMAANWSGPSKWITLAPMQFRNCSHERPAVINNDAPPNLTRVWKQVEPESKVDHWGCFISEDCGHSYFSWRNQMVTTNDQSLEAPKVAPEYAGALGWVADVNGFLWVQFALENTFDYLLVICATSVLVTVLNRLLINGFWIRNRRNGGRRFIKNHLWFNAADMLNIRRFHRVGFSLLFVVLLYNAYFIWSVSQLI